MSFTKEELIENQERILKAIQSPIVKEEFRKYIDKITKEKEENEKCH